MTASLSLKPNQAAPPSARQAMRVKAFRLGLTLAAFALAISLVVLVSHTAEESKGPITNLMVMSSKVAEKAEETLVLSGRESQRTQRLSWFAPLAESRLALIQNKSVLLGAYDNESNDSYHALTTLEDSLRTTFPLVHLYGAWGDKVEQQFPETQVKQIRLMGSVPFITWEPWLTDFSSEEHPRIKSGSRRDAHGMKDVSRGVYDFYLKEWAAKAAASGGPLYIRLGHEMNDPYRYPWGPHNNTAKEFVAMWKHVRAIFRAAGAYNIVWVWSPHPAYGWFDAYYPGDQEVDMVGVGVLNYGTVANWSQWWTFQDIFGKPYKELAKYSKPMVITEFASLAVGGNRLDWYKQALTELPQSFPLVRTLMFFHVSSDNTTTQQTLNWYIKDDPKLVGAIRSSIKGWPAGHY